MKRLGVCGLLFTLLTGCTRDGGRREHSAPGRVADVRSDSAQGVWLPFAAVPAGLPAPALTQVRVSPARGLPPPALPQAEPGVPEVAGAGPAGGDSLPADDRLRPPILRSPARLLVRGPRPGSVELEVRVDETGAVSDAQPVAAGADADLAAAAVRAMRQARYYPATRAGRPVAVWCRQLVEVRRR